jgi:hypothetical protein
MPRGKRTKINPAAKLVDLHKKLGNTLDALLASADSPDFLPGLKAVRDQIQAEAKESSTLDKPTKDVMKIMGQYNEDFSKLILSMVRGKVSELKELGAIDQFKKQQPKPQPSSSASSEASEEEE